LPATASCSMPGSRLRARCPLDAPFCHLSCLGRFFCNRS